MKTNLLFLLELIGQNEAEAILQAHVKNNWVSGDKRVKSNGGEIRAYKKKHFPLGRRGWSDEDTQLLGNRAHLLRADGKNTTQICKELAIEFHRTPSAIFNRLNKKHLFN